MSMSNVSMKFQKAKIGALFYESPNQFAESRILKFLGIEENVLRDVRGRWLPAVKFEVVSANDDGTDGNVFYVDADDRYGHFPPLSKTNADKIIARVEYLRTELAKYETLYDDIRGL